MQYIFLPQEAIPKPYLTPAIHYNPATCPFSPTLSFISSTTPFPLSFLPTPIPFQLCAPFSLRPNFPNLLSSPPPPHTHLQPHRGKGRPAERLYLTGSSCRDSDPQRKLYSDSLLCFRLPLCSYRQAPLPQRVIKVSIILHRWNLHRDNL